MQKRTSIPMHSMHRHVDGNVSGALRLNPVGGGWFDRPCCLEWKFPRRPHGVRWPCCSALTGFAREVVAKIPTDLLPLFDDRSAVPPSL